MSDPFCEICMACDGAHRAGCTYFDESDLQAAVASARRKALEEAATLAEGFWVNMPGQSRGKALAERIRKLGEE